LEAKERVEALNIKAKDSDLGKLCIKEQERINKEADIKKDSPISLKKDLKLIDLHIFESGMQLLNPGNKNQLESENDIS
jgi:hypothetical protein